MIADAFDHRGRAGIAHRKALAGDAVEERFAAGRAVEHDVADQEYFLPAANAEFLRRIHNEPSAGKSLADVIVGVAFERQRHAVAPEMRRNSVRRIP